MFPVNESFDEEFINVDVDGFKGAFSINDLITTAHDEGIYAKLYKNVQRNWLKCRDEILSHPQTLQSNV